MGALGGVQGLGRGLRLAAGVARAFSRCWPSIVPQRPTHPYCPPTHSHTSLTFTDFLEALGRVADAKSLPTASDLDEAGYASILDWCAVSPPHSSCNS